MPVVVDASVIVKWFVEEEYSRHSVRLRDDYTALKVRLVVPSLARYEVLNILRYSGGFGTEDLLRVSSALEEYQFQEVALNGRYAEETAKIAIDYGVTIYDSSYIAIGKIRGSDVYTADEKLLQKVKGLAFVNHIREYGRKRPS